VRWEEPYCNRKSQRDNALVVVDAGVTFNAVLQVDPVTGNRTVVSGCVGFDITTGLCQVRGSGPSFRRPLALAVEADGSLVVVDAGFTFNGVLRVDPVTGNRVVLSDRFVGTGPPFEFPLALAVEANGILVVVNAGFTFNGVLRVDPATGDRVVLSGRFVGAGPLFLSPLALAVEADGSLVAVDAGLKAVVRVNPVTGDRHIVSGCTHFDLGSPDCMNTIGSGPSFSLPASIAIAPDGFLVVTDFGLAAVLLVDPQTGDRSILSSRGGFPVARP